MGGAFGSSVVVATAGEAAVGLGAVHENGPFLVVDGVDRILAFQSIARASYMCEAACRTFYRSVVCNVRGSSFGGILTEGGLKK